MERIELADGRMLEFVVEGPPGGLPLVMHHGTPGAGVRYAPLAEATTGRGLRLVLPTRAGYAGSTAKPGRRVADVAADVTAILDAIGADRFVTAGWSGGGPHALACAALLPGRCLAAATVAGVAPYRAEGLDWLAGMGEENLVEFGAAVQGAGPLDRFLEQVAPEFARVQAADVVAAFGDLLSEVDRKALVGGFAEYLAEFSRRALSTGIDGWRDDDLAFMADWGFEIAEITTPLSIWQGQQDRMVPYAHGAWLAERAVGAKSHLLPDAGHVSLVVRVGDVLDELVSLAR
jgi:pimeloyl-ACP methyl ester carboxylesterase